MLHKNWIWSPVKYWKLCFCYYKRFKWHKPWRYYLWIKRTWRHHYCDWQE